MTRKMIINVLVITLLTIVPKKSNSMDVNLDQLYRPYNIIKKPQIDNNVIEINITNDIREKSTFLYYPEENNDNFKNVISINNEKTTVTVYTQTFIENLFLSDIGNGYCELNVADKLLPYLDDPVIMEALKESLNSQKNDPFFASKVINIFCETSKNHQSLYASQNKDNATKTYTNGTIGFIALSMEILLIFSCLGDIFNNLKNTHWEKAPQFTILLIPVFALLCEGFMAFKSKKPSTSEN